MVWVLIPFSNSCPTWQVYTTRWPLRARCESTSAFSIIGTGGHLLAEKVTAGDSYPSQAHYLWLSAVTNLHMITVSQSIVHHNYTVLSCSNVHLHDANYYCIYNQSETRLLSNSQSGCCWLQMVAQDSTQLEVGIERSELMLYFRVTHRYLIKT